MTAHRGFSSTRFNCRAHPFTPPTLTRTSHKNAHFTTPTRSKPHTTISNPHTSTANPPNYLPNLHATHSRNNGLEPLLHLPHPLNLLVALIPPAQLRPLLGRQLLLVLAPRAHEPLRPPATRRLPAVSVPQAAPPVARARAVRAPPPVQSLLRRRHAAAERRRAA